jgi:uncharacterized protein YdhG (YjbR/CyaY superfamily)
MPKPDTIAEYLDTLTADQRIALDALMTAIRAAVPDAEEVISYDMPAFKVDGRLLVSCAAFKAHCSLFPASALVCERLGDEVAPYVVGRGTFRFRAGLPIPSDLVTRIVQIRLEEHAARGR